MGGKNVSRCGFWRLAAGLLLSALWVGGEARADEPAASLDQLLGQAMDGSPTIGAAKAKVALAQAELSSTRLEVARQVISLWDERQTQQRLVALARDQVKRVEATFAAGRSNDADKQAAQKALIDAEAKLSRIQTELRYLTGAVQMPASNPAAARNPFDSVPNPAPPLQVPHGPMAEKVRQAFASVRLTMQFVQTQSRDVVDYLTDVTKIPFVMDSERGDFEVNIDLKQVTLAAALQAIEDKNDGVQFVVRDYGILLTNKRYSKEHGFFPALDFARQPSPTGPYPPPPAPVQPLPPGNK